jgi:hypothetical protein
MSDQGACRRWCRFLPAVAVILFLVAWLAYLRWEKMAQDEEEFIHQLSGQTGFDP